MIPVSSKYKQFVSPSMRREWIEISNIMVSNSSFNVSLHAEGVD